MTWTETVQIPADGGGRLSFWSYFNIPDGSCQGSIEVSTDGGQNWFYLQTFGRTARNVRGRVILYADAVTPSMARAMEESERRRKKQLRYNQRHGVTPESIVSTIHEIRTSVYEADYVPIPNFEEETSEYGSLEELRDIFSLLDIEMDVWFFESEVDEPSKAIVNELLEKGIAEDERAEGGPVIVKIDEKYFRPSEVDLLVGDPSKAERELGWKAKMDLREILEEMVTTIHALLVYKG